MRAGRAGAPATGPTRPPLFERARAPRLARPEDAVAEILGSDSELPAWLLAPFGRGHPDGFVASLERCYPWRPAWPKPGPRHALYFEIANRIACLHRLAEDRPRARLHFLRWMDRYLPAAIYMQSANRYDCAADDLRAVWPEAGTCADADALPCIETHVLQAPRWGADRDSPFDHPADLALIDVLKKADCAPCRYRGYGSIVKNRLELDCARYLYDALARMIAVSLLGSQKRASVQACFALRWRVYEWYCFSGSDREGLRDWIERNPMLLTYCLREHAFATAEALPAFERYMAERRRWYSMRRNALNAMDEVRSMLNEAHAPRELVAIPSARGLRFRRDRAPDPISPLSDYNDRNLRISPRPMTEELGDKMRKTFAALDKDRGEPEPPPEPEEIDAIERVDRIVRAYEPRQRWPYELLHRYFAVSFDSVMELEAGEEAFVNEVDRTRIRHALESVRARSARDYRILRAYFDSLRKALGLVFSDLPYCETERQIRTLRVQYGLSPGEPLPEAAGTFFACPNCTFFKAEVRHDYSRRGKKEVRTPIFDAFGGKIYCRRLIPRRQPAYKRRFDEKSAARQAKKARDEDPCKRTELIKVNMIGRIAWSREQKASVFMCPACARLCTHGRHSIVGGSLGCGCESRAPAETHACSICSQRKAEPAWLTVADDRETPTRIRSLPFCDKHYPRWTKRAHQIERLSQIKTMLELGAFTVAVRDEYDGEEVDRVPVVGK